MKKMKFLALALIGVLAVSAAACGNGAGNGANATEAPSNKDSGTNKKTYTVATDTTFAPFEYLDPATGKYIGIDMELLQAISDAAGFKYEIQALGFDAACTALETSQVDAVIAGMTIKPARQEKYDFSEPYFEDGSVLVVAANSNIDSIEAAVAADGKFAAKRGTTSADTTLTYVPESRVTYFDDSATMYQAVMAGDCIACLEDYSVMNYSIQQNKLALKTVGSLIGAGNYGFAVLKGKNAELITMFNSGLATIKQNGTYDKILAKYLGK